MARFFFLITVMTLLFGCGQKGDLYLPPPEQGSEAEASDQQAANEATQADAQ